MTRFLITTSKGLEELLVLELQALARCMQAEITIVEKNAGRILIEAPEDAYTWICLHSRIALRVLKPLFTFDCPDEKKLYGGIRSFRWMDHFDSQATVAVSFHTKDSAITHSRFGAQKTKDAIVDQMKSFYGDRPNVDVESPDFHLHVYLLNDHAEVSLDLSAISLHERGYRRSPGSAPLKENLAAGLLYWMGWYPRAYGKLGDIEPVADGAGFYDFFSGSGTLVIEAAQIAEGLSPSLTRTHYGFNRWKFHRAESMEKARALQLGTFHKDSEKKGGIWGSDKDDAALSVARRNASMAKVGDRVKFRRLDMMNLEGQTFPRPPTDTGVTIVNPPYGERLGEEREWIPLYRGIGDRWKQSFAGWRAGVITGSSLLSKELGLKADRRIPVWNGPMECRFLTFSLYAKSGNVGANEI